MTGTSGTYSFNPPIGSLAQSALARCGVHRTAITSQHMDDAYLESNYMQKAWSNDGLTLWTVDLQTISLIQGTATYSVPAETVMILDLYITVSNNNNRLIYPFSRTDYASLANPQTQGVPTSFWFDRLETSPTVTFWPVPDGGGPYTASYYRYREIQDANIPQGGNVEVPELWLDVFVAGLAHRLSRIYAPTLEAQRKADYDIAYELAAKQNTENVPLFFNPALQGYFR
jgi:hypothetical protein